MSEEEWATLNSYEDSGYSFPAAMSILFGDRIVSMGILSETAKEMVADHSADRQCLQKIENPAARETMKLVCAISEQAAETIVCFELKEWQHENWPSWGQPSE